MSDETGRLLTAGEQIALGCGHVSGGSCIACVRRALARTVELIAEEVSAAVEAGRGFHLAPLLALPESIRRWTPEPSSSAAPRADPATIPLCVVMAPRVAQERMGNVAEASAMGWKLTGNVVEPLPAPAPRQPKDPPCACRETTIEPGVFSREFGDGRVHTRGACGPRAADTNGGTETP